MKSSWEQGYRQSIADLPKDMQIFAVPEEWLPCMNTTRQVLIRPQNKMYTQIYPDYMVVTAAGSFTQLLMFHKTTAT